MRPQYKLLDRRMSFIKTKWNEVGGKKLIKKKLCVCLCAYIVSMCAWQLDGVLVKCNQIE